MKGKPRPGLRIGFLVVGGAIALLIGASVSVGSAEKPSPTDLAAEYTTHVRPIVTRYCLGCHSEKEKKGNLNLERFTSLDKVLKESPLWQTVAELLEQSEMPPKDKPQPKPEERRRVVMWVRQALESEVRCFATD